MLKIKKPSLLQSGGLFCMIMKEFVVSCMYSTLSVVKQKQLLADKLK
jgi:hypothetical protein